MSSSTVTFRGVSLFGDVAALLGNRHVAGKARPQTFCIVAYDLTASPRVIGYETAKTDAAVASLRALAKPARPANVGFLTLAQMRRWARAT